MDKYKVKVNPRAIRELDHIYEYIANESAFFYSKIIYHSSNESLASTHTCIVTSRYNISVFKGLRRI